MIYRYYLISLFKGKITLFLLIVVTFGPVNNTKKEGYLKEAESTPSDSAFWKRKVLTLLRKVLENH